MDVGTSDLNCYGWVPYAKYLGDHLRALQTEIHPRATDYPTIARHRKGRMSPR